jgi:voltage-gated potassium channel Kch
VHAIDRSEAVLRPLADVDAAYAGDASDRALLGRAGLLDARFVVLTTNDEAMNIYLSM